MSPNFLVKFIVVKKEICNRKFINLVYFCLQFGKVYTAVSAYRNNVAITHSSTLLVSSLHSGNLHLAMNLATLGT